MMKRTLLLSLMAITILMLVSCASTQEVVVAPIPLDQNPDTQLTQTEQAINNARADRIDLLSPTWFSNAERTIQEARRFHSQGGSTKDVFEKLAKGRAELAKASEIAKMSFPLLKAPIEARQKALKAGANPNTPTFRQVQAQFTDLAQEIEEGDTVQARRELPQVIKAFNDLEIKAIKDKSLGRAKKTLEKARTSDAEDLAPKSLKEANQAMEETERYIERNPDDEKGIKARAEQVEFLAERAANIAYQSKAIAEEDPEATALRVEGMIHSIGNTVKREDTRNRPLMAQVSQIQGLIAFLKKDSYAMKKDSKQSAQELADLKREKEFQARFVKIRDWFDAEDAEVYKEGDRLVLRLKGIQFPSGKASLADGNYPLLKRVQEAIQEFGRPFVTIEGHTDSIGSSETNLSLSLDRANVVKNYFIIQGGIAEEYITAQGYGFERPISTNKTTEGRAQNRRIDVLIEP